MFPNAVHGTPDIPPPTPSALGTPTHPDRMVSATLLLLVALFAALVARKTQRWYALQAFGGHWSAGWSRLWLLQTQKSGHMNKIFTDINRKYGM